MIYLLVFIYLLILSVFFDFLKVKGPKNFFYYLSMIILILIAGLRWKVGGDSLTYQLRFETLIYPIDQFSRINLLEIGWEPGYVLVNSVAKFIVQEFWFFQLIQAIFVNVIIFQFFKRYTPYYFTSILLYTIFFYFYFNMEILREIISICIFIKWMYPALEKSNYKKYYLFNIIALFFHTSAIILLLIPLLSSFKLNKKGIYVLFGVTLVMVSLFTMFPDLINIISFSDRLASKFLTYSKYSLNIFGMASNFIMFGVFPYYLIALNKKYVKNITFEKLVYPYFVIVAVYIAYSGFGRFINYFGPFMLVFFVNTIYLVMNVKKFRKFRTLIILTLLIGPLFYKYQYYTGDTSMYYRGTRKFNLWYPYSGIIEKKEYDFRQIIFQEGLKDSYNSTTETRK